jgi:hypothetical protein
MHRASACSYSARAHRLIRVARRSRAHSLVLAALVFAAVLSACRDLATEPQLAPRPLNGPRLAGFSSDANFGALNSTPSGVYGGTIDPVDGGALPLARRREPFHTQPSSR